MFKGKGFVAEPKSMEMPTYIQTMGTNYRSHLHAKCSCLVSVGETPRASPGFYFC